MLTEKKKDMEQQQAAPQLNMTEACDNHYTTDAKRGEAKDWS